MAELLVSLIFAVALLIIAWVLVDRFSPDPTVTLICRVLIFVFAMLLIFKLLIPMVAV